MTLTFLGTGTSCGVPVLGCQCPVCQSTDPHDKRTRCAALVETATTRILVDCGPDFRQQMLPQPFRKIDAILVTHAHYDHIGGMDDIRPYCQFGEINVYADKQALVLVNRGGATGADIVRLCEAIRHDVSQRFGIDIHPEVNII